MSTINKCDRCGKEMNSIYTRFTVDCLRGHLERDNHILDLCEKCNEEFEEFMKSTKTSEVKEDCGSGNPPRIHGCEQCEFQYAGISVEPCVSCDYGKSNFKPKDTKDTGRTYSVGSYAVSKSNRSRVCKITDTVKNDQGDVCYKLVGLDSKRTENTVTKNYLDSYYAIFYDPLSANDDSDSDSDVIACEQCKFKDFSWDEEPCSTCKYSVMSICEDSSDNFESKEEEDADILSKAKYKLGSYIQSSDGKGDIYKIVDAYLINDGEIAYRLMNLSLNTYSTLTESIIDNWYTVIVKYSCDGCKLEGIDDVMCDTCIVGDPKGPRRQWWKPKEEG